jgi:glycine/D-amino acid oxidase-like deaminating enzyme
MDTRTGRNTGYVQGGILFTAANEKAFGQYDRWTENLTAHQMECRMVVGHELDRLMPGHRLRLRGAMYTPKDGRAEPQWAAPAIAEAARDAGARIFTRCAARVLDISAGRVSGVVTEKGRIACKAVVLAGGAWSRLFAGNEDVELPQLKVLNSVLRTSRVENGPDVTVWTDRFAMRKRADGGYSIASGNQNTVDIVPDSFRLARTFWPAFKAEWRALRFRLSDRWREETGIPLRWTASEISPFETRRILDPAPSSRTVTGAWRAARAAFPVLEPAELIQAWGGMIDVTPDALPVMSEVESLPGFFIATGFSGHGFGIAPGAGRLMADLVTGAAPVVDPHDFRLSRFTDGSRIVSLSGF